MSKTAKKKKQHEPKQEPLTFKDTFIIMILPVIFGLMGILAIDAAQPLTAIILASCALLIVLAILLPIFLKRKGIHFSHELEDYLLGFSLIYMLFHLNLPSLYLTREHLFWFFLLAIIWLVTCSTVIAVYVRAKDRMSKPKYDTLKKYYNRFFLSFGILSFLSFILSTLGYNRARAYFEDTLPPAVFFFGENSGHIIIMLSFSIAMTIIYGYGIFMTAERIIKRQRGLY